MEYVILKNKTKLTQNLMQLLSSVRSRRKMKRRQVMIKTPEDYFHTSRKNIRKHQRRFIKTGILTFSLVISLYSLISDTNYEL
jgi:hypothetical protein